jgi:hypothetical protein
MEAEMTGAMVDERARRVIARDLVRLFEEVVTEPPPKHLVILLERLKVQEDASFRKQQAVEHRQAHRGALLEQSADEEPSG